MSKEMYKYAKIKRYDFDFPPYWVVVLDTMPRVLRYLEEVKSLQLWNALKGLKQIEKSGLHQHLTMNEFLVDTTIDTADFNGEIRNDVFDDMAILGRTFNTPYLHVFIDKGTLYVGKEGGFFPAAAIKHDILDERETKEYEFPVEVKEGEREIRIAQWMGGGTHYYAKVGDKDVVVDGVQKWNTWDEAMTAANKFIAKSFKGLNP